MPQGSRTIQKTTNSSHTTSTNDLCTGVTKQYPRSCRVYMIQSKKYSENRACTAHLDFFAMAAIFASFPRFAGGGFSATLSDGRLFLFGGGAFS